MVFVRYCRIARVFAFRRKYQKAILPDGKPLGFHARLDLLVRRAGVGRALEGDDLPAAKVWGQPIHGAGYKRQVRFAVQAQRCRHADDDGIGFGRSGEIRGCLKAASAGPRYRRGGNVLYVALAVPQQGDFFRVVVYAEHAIAYFRKPQRQRQADVSKPDNRDRRFLALQPADEAAGEFACRVPGRPARSRLHRRKAAGQRVIHERERTVMIA